MVYQYVCQSSNNVSSVRKVEGLFLPYHVMCLCFNINDVRTTIWC